MHFDCPGCKQRFEIDNDRAGEHLSCPVCERVIRVPMAPLVIHKGRLNGGVRLVPIPPQARIVRKGSLAERVAALKAAKPTSEEAEFL